MTNRTVEENQAISKEYFAKYHNGFSDTVKMMDKCGEQRISAVEYMRRVMYGDNI